MDREIEKLNEILKKKSDEIELLQKQLEEERKLGGRLESHHDNEEKDSEGLEMEEKRIGERIVVEKMVRKDEKRVGSGRREEERREEEVALGGLGGKSYYEERIRVLIGDNEKMAGILRMQMSKEVGLVSKVEEMGRENQMMKMEIERMRFIIGDNNK